MRYGNHIPPPHSLDVWFFEAGAVVRHIQLEVDDELSEAFADWRAGSAEWNRTFTNYAPKMLVRTDSGCSINFSAALVIVNCNGQQWKRDLTDADVALKDSLFHAIAN